VRDLIIYKACFKYKIISNNDSYINNIKFIFAMRILYIKINLVLRSIIYRVQNVSEYFFNLFYDVTSLYFLNRVIYFLRNNKKSLFLRGR